MNINDIMRRDWDICHAEERKQRKRAARVAVCAGDECGFPWVAVAVWLAVALAALGVAFCGGIWYESRRALKADRDFAAWCDRVEREATERTRAMSNYELLNATRRECADPANR